ncbi:hypothetical protein FSP39_024270 [Pinctada imbricata]|uniref:Uncharacterized protein n=1 Tax=Pinctada imbricata TaxID=66713 RepID=A0AA88Y297_PINIB|nr:hypothetical protein FSP39_024270 [Pinctada imbricata]
MDYLHSFFKVLSFLTVLLHVADGKCAEYNSEIVYKWITHEFLWPSEEVKQEYNSTGRYIKENNALNGIKLYNGSVYPDGTATEDRCRCKPRFGGSGWDPVAAVPALSQLGYACHRRL